MLVMQWHGKDVHQEEGRLCWPAATSLTSTSCSPIELRDFRGEIHPRTFQNFLNTYISKTRSVSKVFMKIACIENSLAARKKEMTK